MTRFELLQACQNALQRIIEQEERMLKEVKDNPYEVFRLADSLLKRNHALETANYELARLER